MFFDSIMFLDKSSTLFVGSRDYRDHDFRARPERRHSPHGRYSPERDIRRRSLRDKKPSSEDRGNHFFLCTLVPLKIIFHGPFYLLSNP